MCGTYNYRRSSSNSFHTKITEFFQIKKFLWSFIKCSVPPWLAMKLGRRIILTSFLLAVWKNIQIAWIISSWKIPFLVLGLCYTFSFGNMSKSCSNLQSLWMPHVSIFLLRAIYPRWDTQRIVITLQLGISFCLQVLSTGSKEMMILHLLLFLTGNNNFYDMIPTVHLHRMGQTKTEYCLQLGYQPRSWEV